MTKDLKVQEFLNTGLDLISCYPDEEITSVKTKMLVNNFSQIPIVDNNSIILGCISWKSIGKTEALGNSSKNAKDYSESPMIIKDSDNFLNHIKTIAENEYVLVTDSKKKFKGILTTYDMTIYFYDFINPYLRIGIIEDCIRKIIKEAGIELKKEVDQLTFYEYQKELDKEENWKNLKISQLNKDVFISKIDQIRSLRNRIAHYKPNRINNSEQFLINSFADLLENICK